MVKVPVVVKKVAKRLGLTSSKKGLSEVVTENGVVCARSVDGNSLMIYLANGQRIEYENMLASRDFRRGDQVELTSKLNYRLTLDYKGQDFSRKVETERVFVDRDVLSIRRTSFEVGGLNSHTSRGPGYI